ncbi:MAG: glycosyltransferase [Bacteroides sp.]|nr:glycosyltransferase [Bacteroides sp.]MCM1094703.1 glycosyltransferase [Terasakiella sp.]
MNPLFSIITVSYNAAGTIGRTLDSVASQTCGLYEHIVVDGASTDGTQALVAAAAGADRRCLISEPDRGLYDAMNKGMALATGDYLIFLNSGDKFHSTDTLQLIADTIMREDYPGVVYGQTDLVDDSGRRIGPRHLTAPERLEYADFALGMLVCHQAFVVLARIAPRYSMQYRFSADYDWCVQCLQHSRRNVYTGAVLIDYLSEGLTTANRRASLMERFRIMCRYYGTLPTVWRHVGFFFRNLKRKFNVPV